MKVKPLSLPQCFVLSVVLAAVIVGIRRSGEIDLPPELTAQLSSTPIFLVPVSSFSSSSVISAYLESGDEFPTTFFTSSSRRMSSKQGSQSSVSSIINFDEDFWKDLPPFIAPVSSSSLSFSSSSERVSDHSFFPTPLPAQYQASSKKQIFFSDISRVSPEGNAAYLLAERGIVSGFPDGTFRPDAPINRAEITKFILRARNGNVEIADLVYDGAYTDVARNEWYVRYIMTATRLGIIRGYPDGTFKAGYLVNTAEFLKMISIAFHLEESATHAFQDVPHAAWYAKYAGIAATFTLFPQRPASFLQPERYLTRGEVVYALSKVLRLQ